ncbi:MAG: transcription antitermination factor NusB [Candidatus Nomurabacteria bacterium]|nr:transcription antitermination factor NusB [Candidatus Nomurabacteria bacterium]
MSNRHLARSTALQTLFEWDFNSYENARIPELMQKNITEFAQGMEDNSFVSELVDGVIKKQKIIDEIITKAAPDWPLEKIGNVDRNVLRIGLYELLFGDRDQVPPKVAINESIELAKSFGGEKSGKFINGVLGAVYKEIGEPGKDQSTKKFDDDTPLEELPIEIKGGAVIYNRSTDGILSFCMVHDVFGYWTLSKGGIDSADTPEKGTVKKIKEETTLDINIIEKLGENEYISKHPEQGRIRKQVTYFLAEAPEKTEPKLEEDSGGLDDVRWFTLEQIGELKMYEDVTQMMAMSIEKLTS